MARTHIGRTSLIAATAAAFAMTDESMAEEPATVGVSEDESAAEDDADG